MPLPHKFLCPRCSSDRIKRSHSRSIIEKALKAINIRPYRCIHCGWRGFRYSKESTHARIAKYSLIQLILIVSALALAVIATLYYLSREEPKPETLSSLPRNPIILKTCPPKLTILRG